MEDKQIIELYWKRDQSAITQTEQKYGGYCRRIANNILSNWEDCEECINDTWFRAWNAMPEERPYMLGAFLGAITRNLSLDRYRRKYAARRGSGEVPYIFDELRDCIGGEDPTAYVELAELVDALNRFLLRLNEEGRVMFVRRYWYMDSIETIAKRLGVSESKVKSSLFRSRKKLHKFLEKESLL